MRSSRQTSKGKRGGGTPPPRTTASAPKKPKIIFPVACRLLKDLGEDGFAQICKCMHAKELHLRNKETFIVESDPCAADALPADPREAGEVERV